MTVKRSFSELDNGDISVEKLAMANCALILSRVDDKSGRPLTGRVFKCKTCERQFDSFQALGGHRASHKRPKILEGYGQLVNKDQLKIKKHECSVCGLEFGTGQALGGHMRRHRGEATVTGGDKSDVEGNAVVSEAKEVVPILKKCNSNSKRVLCLDLNLMPNENSFDLDLDLRL